MKLINICHLLCFNCKMQGKMLTLRVFTALANQTVAVLLIPVFSPLCIIKNIAATFDNPFNSWIEQCAVVSSRFPDEMLKVSQQWHFYWINSKEWVDGIWQTSSFPCQDLFSFFLCDQKPISFVIYLVKDTYLYSLQKEDENTY